MLTRCSVVLCVLYCTCLPTGRAELYLVLDAAVPRHLPTRAITYGLLNKYGHNFKFALNGAARKEYCVDIPYTSVHRGFRVPSSYVQYMYALRYHDP
jgi:hypothetical protein